MKDICVIGTDTDAGKTTFSLLWLSAWGGHYGYWKPLETGASDSAIVRRLVPECPVFPPIRHFEEPVAPLLAARREGWSIPEVRVMAAARPNYSPLVIETFGSPFSPLGEDSLQIEWLRLLHRPLVLVTSSAVGAIGRSLQCIESLRGHGLAVRALVLLGPRDIFAEEQIHRNGACSVFSLERPVSWDAAGFREASERQRSVLEAIADALSDCPRMSETVSSEWVRRDQQAIWHPYTSLQPADPPLVITGANDEFLYLANGRRVIDAISSWWTILFGHRDPVLVRALTQALSQIDHVHFAGTTHPWAVELSEYLLATMPWSGGRVFFSDNGSTAVEVALKMAYQYWRRRGETQRTLFVGFEHGYHGDTFGAMAVGRDPLFFGDFEPLLFRAIQVPLDANHLDATLRHHQGEVAAVIIEPLVQGAGGMRMHTPSVLRQIAQVVQQHGTLFIADEVMTGGGRLGPLWAFQAANIAPDLVCAAKTLTGGMMPLAATIASPSIVAAWQTDDPQRTFFHGHSFTGHPLACAVAAANWRRLPRGGQPKAQTIESFWRESLEALLGHPQVRDVRTRGSIVAVELKGDSGYLASVGPSIRRSCLASDVLLRPLGSVVYAMPPLNASLDSLAQIAEAILTAINTIHSGR